MDDVFQILIYLIIIVSFISSFFRKKAQTKGSVPPSTSSENPSISDYKPVAGPSAETKAQEFDILREFENFFKVEERAVKPEASVKPIERKEPLIRDSNFKRVPEESFHTVTDSEHSFVNPWETKIKEAEKKKRLITPQIEKQASAYEQSLLKKEKTTTDIAGKIRIGLIDSASLKEYVIVSEILGRPKALSKWNRKSIS